MKTIATIALAACIGAAVASTTIFGSEVIGAADGKGGLWGAIARNYNNRPGYAPKSPSKPYQQNAAQYSKPNMPELDPQELVLNNWGLPGDVPLPNSARCDENFQISENGRARVNGYLEGVAFVPDNFRANFCSAYFLPDGCEQSILINVRGVLEIDSPTRVASEYLCNQLFRSAQSGRQKLTLSLNRLSEIHSNERLSHRAGVFSIIMYSTGPEGNVTY